MVDRGPGPPTARVRWRKCRIVHCRLHKCEFSDSFAKWSDIQIYVYFVISIEVLFMCKRRVHMLCAALRCSTLRYAVSFVRGECELIPASHG